MTEAQFDPAPLRAMGETPEAVQARVRDELDQFEAHLKTRQSDWSQVQPGREWSPAQEAEHVVLINRSITSLVALLMSDKPLRAAPQVPGSLKDGKRQAPPFSVPSEGGLAWDDLQTQWAEHRAALLAVTDSVRETPGRTFWHPFFGELGALDWTRMVAGHLGNHRRLLEKSAAAHATGPGAQN